MRIDQKALNELNAAFGWFRKIIEHFGAANARWKITELNWYNWNLNAPGVTFSVKPSSEEEKNLGHTSVRFYDGTFILWMSRAHFFKIVKYMPRPIVKKNRPEDDKHPDSKSY
jgi:hypothetical protein